MTVINVVLSDEDLRTLRRWGWILGGLVAFALGVMLHGVVLVAMYLVGR